MKHKQTEKEGISLRTIQLWMIIGAAVVSALVLYVTFDLSNSFHHLTNTSEQQIELRKAARELMDASDYLTEQVQRYTVLGDQVYLDNYFEEALRANHREEAVSRMAAGEGSEAALAELQEAMNASLRLMDREYYAMRLVLDARGETECPEPLLTVALTRADQDLSPAAKLRLAAEMTHDDGYYSQKNVIREKMRASLDKLEQLAYETDATALEDLGSELTAVRLVIGLETLGIFFMVWLTSRLGIHPVLNAVERIKADSPIPEVGANEFRYLANAYNKMYGLYKTSLERLNFKASHDVLTGAYNRTGYELLLSSVDLDSTYMLLFDLDNFKNVNDSFGHETGDQVLKKLVRVLKSNFRADDHICRIGGDEFVVFMVHSTRTQRAQIGQKIREINRALLDTEDGLPPVSVSVGVVHGSEAGDAERLFALTDAAMYQAKQSGKNTYVIRDE